MKNICISISSLGSGGAEKQSLLLAKALNEKYSVSFLALRDNNIQDERQTYNDQLKLLDELNIPTVILKGTIVRKALTFHKFLNNHKIDLIFSYLPSDTIFMGILGKCYRIPFVVGGIRNSIISKHKAILLRIIHNTFLNYSISNSYQAKRIFVKKGYRSSKLAVIHNGLQIKQKSYIRPEQQPVTILTISRFVPQKDHYTALKSLRYLLNNYHLSTEIKYKIVGYGEWEESIKNWIQELNLVDYVEMHINPSNIPQLLHESDVYLSTSLFEGLSNSIMEAMEHSLPIIATNVGDNEQLIIDDVNGFIVETKQYEEIADKLSVLINSYEKRIEFGQNSYAHITENFSYEAFKIKYFNFIESISNGCKAAK